MGEIAQILNRNSKNIFTDTIQTYKSKMSKSSNVLYVRNNLLSKQDWVNIRDN